MDGAEAEPDEVVVDDAEIVAVEVAPDDRDEGCGDDHGQEKGEAEEVEKHRWHLTIERQREKHAHRDVARYGEEREAQGVPEDLQGAIIGEEAGEIVEPNPARALHRVVIGETQNEGD